MRGTARLVRLLKGDRRSFQLRHEKPIRADGATR